jgi:hypothetical protein
MTAPAARARVASAPASHHKTMPRRAFDTFRYRVDVGIPLRLYHRQGIEARPELIVKSVPVPGSHSESGLQNGGVSSGARAAVMAAGGWPKRL